MTLPLLPLIHYKLIKNTVLLYGLSSYHLASLLQFTPTPVNGCFCAYRRNLFFHFAQMPPLKFSYPHSCPASLFYPLFSLQSTPFCPFFSFRSSLFPSPYNLSTRHSDGSSFFPDSLFSTLSCIIIS